MSKTSYLMKTTGLSLVLLLGGVQVALAQDVSASHLPTKTSAVEQRVQKLLQQAVAHIQQKGVVGVNDFNRDARFVDRDLYVFSVTTDGVVLASGGGSAIYIGENVWDLADIHNRYFFREIIEGAQAKGSGQVQYQWYNPADGGDKAKLTSYERVGDIIVAVGYFPTMPTLEHIEQLLNAAIAQYEQNPKLALRRFANRAGEFQYKGLKVLVIDTTTQKVVFDAANRQLDGVSVQDIVDVTGQPFLQEMVQLAVPNSMQQLTSLRLNLQTKRVVEQQFFFKRSGSKVIAIQQDLHERRE